MMRCRWRVRRFQGGYIEMSGRRVLSLFVNRNPRNLEMLGLQAPPKGFQLEADRQRRYFIYKVGLIRSAANMDGQLRHYRDGVVLSASTQEKSIAAQLYSRLDTSAALNLGRILAVRCFMAGIYFAMPTDSEEEISKSRHLQAFYNALRTEGFNVGELPYIEHSYRNDPRLTYDSYEVHHTREDKTDE